MNDMINTKVRTHKNLYGVAEKFYGFTARQWIFLILAFAICIPGYLWLKPVIGEELTSWLVILTGGPIILMGFVDIQGQLARDPDWRSHHPDGLRGHSGPLFAEADSVSGSTFHRL